MVMPYFRLKAEENMLPSGIWPVVQSFSNLSVQRSSRDFRTEPSKH